ncbi:hypothetical protein DFH06DRAFT_1372677, partial [Mycena polygramma]
TAAHAPRLVPPTPLLSTAIQHLLRTNEPPGDTEMPIITGLISHFQRAVDALTARIGIPEATLDQLIAERDQMVERVQKYTAVLSPVRRVPPEIMCEIFSRTLPHTTRVCKRFGFDGRSTARREWNMLKRDELGSLAERQEDKSSFTEQPYDESGSFTEAR